MEAADESLKKKYSVDGSDAPDLAELPWGDDPLATSERHFSQEDGP
jgi:hypothetical protein